MQRVEVCKVASGTWRIMENGRPVMHDRKPVDGGGLEHGAAVKLAHDINTRRERAERRQQGE